MCEGGGYGSESVGKNNVEKTYIRAYRRRHSRTGETMTVFLLTFYAGALFGFVLGIGILSMVRVGKRADAHIGVLVKEKR